MPDERVWMKHQEHGGMQHFPRESAESGFWQARGWQPCDSPGELDPRKDPALVDLPAAAPDRPEKNAPDHVGPRPAKSVKPANRPTADNPEE